MPSTSKYNPEYHDSWAWSLAIKGATDEEIADAFGISRRTFIRWKQAHESLAEMTMQGKEIADSRVEKALYQRAIGFEVTDTERIVDVDSDGNTKPVRVRNTTKNYPPDTMAIMYWLNNRSKRTGEWAQRQEVNVGVDAESERTVHIYLPANGRDVVDEFAKDPFTKTES